MNDPVQSGPAWTVTLPGEPPSVNSSYKPGKRTGTRADGSTYTYATIVKRERVAEWQMQMVMVVRSARPSNWRPPFQAVVEIRYWFGKDRDADNPQKAILDVLASATGVNDMAFLPRVMAKHLGAHPRDRRTELVIYEVSHATTDGGGHRGQPEGQGPARSPAEVPG